MSNTFLEPATDHVLVVDHIEGTDIGGISLPDNVRQQEMVFGAVLAVGPLATATKITNRICYGPYAGKTVVVDGVEFRLIREGQIEGYIREKE